MFLGRLAGVDVRAAGSGNVGATNVARTAGLRWGLLTLAVDVSKGALPVLVARWTGASPVTSLAALAAFYGHVFSAFSRFRGGKGVATAAGAFLALAPAATAASLGVFGAVVLVSRTVSLASLAAGLTLPIGIALTGEPNAVFWSGVLVALSLVCTHRDNLSRLLRGTEPRFQPAKPPPTEPS